MANKPLKSIKFPGLDDTYTVAVTDTTLSESGVPADAKVTGNALETKADKDGYYTDLTAGTAEQLLASQSVVDKVPYLFRISGGSIDIGNREYDEIVGGSIVWNQKITFSAGAGEHNGIRFEKKSDGTIIVTGTATANATINLGQIDLFKNHTYLLKGCPQGGSNASYALYANQTNPHLFDTGNGNIKTQLSDTQGIIYIIVYSGQTVDLTFVPQLFDLTQMFGSTIATYITGLEQSSAGAGVAWFKALFPKPYYEYNAGELLSVSDLQSHDTVGFNAWDEEWEAYGTNQIKAKNRIPLIPGETYYCNFLGNMYFYEDLISSSVASVAFSNNTITIPGNAHYGIFYTGTAYGNVYKNDICINLSWSGYRNGEYEPYVKHSYPLDDSLTLRGIPKLDASNNLYYDGDTYASDGTVTRKYGIVDLGTLNWSKYSSANISIFYTSSDIPGLMVNSGNNAVCSKYVCQSWTSLSARIDKTLEIHPTLARPYISDSSYTDVATFKAAMSGVMLVYELATPTTETAEPYNKVQIVDDFGTEEYVTTSIVPVGHKTQYPANLRDKLQHLPNLAENDGYYAIKQEGSQLSLELFRIPKAPTTDGNYTLKATVSGGVPTYTWESEGE